METPGQLPQPSCARTWTSQGGSWGQNLVGCVGRPAPFIRPRKAAGAWLCSHCCLHAALFLFSNPTAAGEISQQNGECRGHVGWAVAVVGCGCEFPTLPAPSTRPGSPQGLCTCLCLCPASPQLVQQLPPPLHPPQNCLARLQSQAVRSWEMSPCVCSAESR